MLPSREKINEMIRELQPILRISNWEIEFDYCDKYRMKVLTGGENVGACDNNLQVNYAHIYINKDSDQINEWYETLVHELYHLVTNDWRYHARSMLDYVKDEAANNKEENMLTAYYEQATDNLARIFCKVYPVTHFFPEEAPQNAV
jgi:hypothetical protein